MKSQSQAVGTLPPIAGVGVTVAKRGTNALQLFVACLMLGACGGAATGQWFAWLRVAFLCGTGVCAVMIGFPAVLDFVLDVAERLSQRDLNQDGKIGTRIVFTNRVPLETKPEAEQFESFVWQCKTSTAGRFLEDQGFSRDQVEEWRNLLLANGMAKWRSERGVTVGWELTKSPDEVLRNVEWPGSEE